MSQTISPQAGRPDSTASKPAKNFSKFFSRLASNRLAVAIVIFLTAFTLRAGHNYSLEHRVWYFEDAQNYLRSGASIYRMVSESKSPSQLIENISKDSKGYSGIYEAFTSDKLVDRMLTDGAVFPIYLAGVEAVAGLDITNPQYENIALKASLANSLLDSATCVLLYLLGTLLFGLTPGALAGLLYALYPPAIVNTQWCMSETFCTFMIVSTVYSMAHYVMLPPSAMARKTFSGAVTGIVTGLTVLARSAFPLFIPFLAIAAFLGTRDRKSLLSPAPLVTMIVALALTLTPWCLYTKSALGQARLTTNRLPAYNVVSGNLASIDGYTPFPSTVAFPEGMKEALAMVVSEAQQRPGDFILLEMKKLARLWSSVWNDCKYSVLGIDAATQTVFHQLMLFLALCWGFIVSARGKRYLTNGELLGTWLTFTAIATHFTYLAFIALSRYAITAMPFVILAASAAVVAWIHSGELAKKKLMLVVGSFVVVAAATNQFRVFSQYVSGLISETWWITFAPWVTALVAIAAYAGVWTIAVRAIYRFTVAAVELGELQADRTHLSTTSTVVGADPITGTTGSTPDFTTANATATATPPAPAPASDSAALISSSADSDSATVSPGSDNLSQGERETAPISNSESIASEQIASADAVIAASAISDSSSSENIPSRAAITTLAAVSLALTGFGIVGCIVGSHTWSEWSCPLTDQEVHQTIRLPALGEVSSTGYVLIDAQDEEPLPSLEVELNDHLLTADAIPLEMIQTENESIIGSLTMQANSMNMDYRSLRHWYAVPFSTDLLRKEDQNTIAVRNKSKTHPVTIYGDFTHATSEPNDGVQVLPSINSLSWNYAVEGSDYHSPMEPRLTESIPINGKTTESSLASKIRSYEAFKDLSPSLGTQWGRYRLRLLLHPLSAKQSQISKKAIASQTKAVVATPDGNVADTTSASNATNKTDASNATSNTDASGATATTKTNASNAASNTDATSATTKTDTPNAMDNTDILETIFAQEPGKESTVHGGNPATFYLTAKPLPVSEALVKNHPIKFTCELKSEKHPVNAFVNLVFKTGIGDVWTPSWQPECIPVDGERWKKITIIDAFPKKLLEHNGVFVQPIITPFGKDLLFTQKKKAGKQVVLIRNAKLEIINADIPERSNLFTWKVF